MRINRGTLAAVGVAGLIALTGSAFTASNTMPADSGTAGYGDVTATGVPVKGIEYVASTTDATKLDKVLVTTEDSDAAAMTGALSIKDSANATVIGAQDCGSGVSDLATPPVYTFTCNPTTDPDMASVVKVGFTATRDAA